MQTLGSYIHSYEGEGEYQQLLRTVMQLTPHCVHDLVQPPEGQYSTTFQSQFFPPRQHIFMHSAHITFVGAPLPQHLLLSGQTWWGSHTWRAPSGNTVSDIHDPPQAQQLEVTVDVSRILAQDLTKLGPAGTSYTINLHVFLRTHLRPLVNNWGL